MIKDKKLFYFRIKLLLATMIFILIALGASFFTYNLGSRMVVKYTPLIDASMEIKLEATTANLWFEEILRGNCDKSIDDVYKSINNSIWYAQAMIHGGENNEGIFLALTDAYLIKDIQNILENLKKFKEIIESRYANVDKSESDSRYIKKYNAVFNEFIQRADKVETRLQKIIALDLQRYKNAYTIVGMSIFIFILLFGYFLYRYQAQKRRSFHALKESHEELKSTKDKLQEAMNANEAILASIPDVMFELDLDGKYVNAWVNNPEKLASIKRELLGHTVIDKLPGHAAQEMLIAMKEAKSKGSSFGRQINIDTPDGSLWFELSVSLKENKQMPHTFIVLSRNITQRKAMELKLLQLSKHDSLTKLYNRRVLEEKLMQDINRANRYKHPLSICLVDIDCLNNINDSYGNLEANEILMEIAKLITSTLRDIDYAGRYAGQVFAIVLPEVELIHARGFAERLKNEIVSKVFIFDNKDAFNISVNIGIAEINEEIDSLDALIKLANLAMDRAKYSGSNKIMSSADR